PLQTRRWSAGRCAKSKPWKRTSAIRPTAGASRGMLFPASSNGAGAVGNPPLINARSGEALATDIELALTRTARRRGLLHRDGLDPTAALILAPCLAVHTAFM